MKIKTYLMLICCALLIAVFPIDKARANETVEIGGGEGLGASYKITITEWTDAADPVGSFVLPENCFESPKGMKFDHWDVMFDGKVVRECKPGDKVEYAWSKTVTVSASYVALTGKNEETVIRRRIDTDEHSLDTVVTRYMHNNVEVSALPLAEYLDINYNPCEKKDAVWKVEGIEYSEPSLVETGKRVLREVKENVIEVVYAKSDDFVGESEDDWEKCVVKQGWITKRTYLEHEEVYSTTDKYERFASLRLVNYVPEPDDAPFPWVIIPVLAVVVAAIVIVLIVVKKKKNKPEA